MSGCRRSEISGEFVLESVNCFGSLAIGILGEFFEGRFSAVCSIMLQSLRVCILDSKPGYISMDCVQPGVDS